jgi:hypothetical protein
VDFCILKQISPLIGVRLLMTLVLSACSSGKLDAARNTIVVADEIQVDGQMYSDSLALAETCMELARELV